MASSNQQVIEKAKTHILYNMGNYPCLPGLPSHYKTGGLWWSQMHVLLPIDPCGKEHSLLALVWTALCVLCLVHMPSVCIYDWKTVTTWLELSRGQRGWRGEYWWRRECVLPGRLERDMADGEIMSWVPNAYVFWPNLLQHVSCKGWVTVIVLGLGHSRSPHLHSFLELMDCLDISLFLWAESSRQWPNI